MMKLIILCILPVVMCAPALDKKAAVGDWFHHITDAFQLDNLKCDIQKMLDVIGSNPGEQACEKECHVLLQTGHILNYACPLVCHGFANMVQLWHIVPDTTDPAASICHNALSHLFTTTLPTTTSS